MVNSFSLIVLFIGSKEFEKIWYDRAVNVVQKHMGHTTNSSTSVTEKKLSARAYFLARKPAG